MRILGIDLGTKKVGLAISDKLGLIANPYETIIYNDYEELLDKIKNVIENLKVEKIVLGLPKNMNNTIGPAGERTLEFSKMLDIFNLEVVLIDERLSTMEAEKLLIENNTRRKSRKKIIDKMAATIILENYLNRKR